ncbi:MAG: zf-HC2 domain-containing protein [Acidobacteriota bacterium]
MSCAPFDLKDYFLGELGEPEAQQVRTHLGACLACREELERLRLTQAALLTLRDEEVPRRIAFVSDKVFERRWWQWLWQSGPRLGFASAAVLSLAILAHALLAPSPPVTQPVDTAALEQRIESAIAKAVAETEARQAAQIQKAVSAAREEMEFQRKADLLAVEENLEVFKKRMNVLQIYLASNVEGGGR